MPKLGLVLIFAGSMAAAQLKYPIDTPLDGPKSVYTGALVRLATHWPVADRVIPSPSASLVGIQCFSTKGQELYVGVGQLMTIDAPITRVRAVLDDIDHYQKLFPGYKDIHVVGRDGNRLVTFWEQIVPLFFVPNVTYEEWYLIDHSAPDRSLYRYQLKKSAKLKKSDGLIVLESKGSQTLYTEYDFWDADYGILGTVGPGKIWEDSVEGLFVSDVAIRLKAEHPEWSYARITEQAKRAFRGFPVEERVKARRAFPFLTD